MHTFSDQYFSQVSRLFVTDVQDNILVLYAKIPVFEASKDACTVTIWFLIVLFKSLAVGSNPATGRKLFCEEAIQLICRKSMVFTGCPKYCLEWQLGSSAGKSAFITKNVYM